MEFGRIYDKGSNTTWVVHRCPKCNSRNLTPMGKRQEGENSLCSYLCEHCGEEFGEVIYAVKGRVLLLGKEGAGTYVRNTKREGFTT